MNFDWNILLIILYVYFFSIFIFFFFLKKKKKNNKRVSSTYQRDVKNFGKQFMTDNDDETCWNSDQVKKI